MRAECHAHIFMDGVNYKESARVFTLFRDHPESPEAEAARERIAQNLVAYQEAGITWIRDGGDPYGACSLAKQWAAVLGLTYRIPVFAIHKAGCYGKIVGKSFETIEDFHTLVKEAKAQGADFIKVMTTGIMDFNHDGAITGTALERNLVHEMISCVHEEGLSIMCHTNGAKAVMDCAEGGADSIEHGNFQTEDSLLAMKENKTIWVPTLVTVRNLAGDGRFPEKSIQHLMQTQINAVKLAYQHGVTVASGSDAGAYRVLHGSGIVEEWESLHQILGQSDAVDDWLLKGEEELMLRF